jgi:hypothetical protein
MKINIESTQQLFLEHLLLEKNERILFSGKFGTGKSYFLGKFFETYKDKYDIFWLSPINYVVGANGDIFEWIKIDIAKHLIEQLDNDKSSNSKNLLVQSFLYRNIGSLCIKLIEIVSGKILHNDTGIDFLDTYKSILNDYRTFEAEHIESEKSPFEILSQRILNETNSRGSIFEDDLISQTIRAAIELLKFQNKKESVLIIDDLDRLDPEHVFRILNIMSAHNNHFDTNKFGFSKVIIVCDIDNIQHLFEYKYGPKSDFDGYIEKYFTYEPFNYTIEKAISFYCENSHFIDRLNDDNKKVLSYLLQMLIKHKKLNTRKLKKIHSYIKPTNYTLFNFVINTNFARVHTLNNLTNTNNIEVDLNEFDFLYVIDILSVAFGSELKFINALEELKVVTIPNNITEQIINSVALIAHISKNTTEGDKVFYSTIRYNNNNQVNIGMPVINSFDINKPFPLRWNSNNKYKSGDFFILEGNTKMYDLYIKDKSGLSMSFETLLTEIKSIISFMKTI